MMLTAEPRFVVGSQVLDRARKNVVDLARQYIGTPYEYLEENCSEPESFNCYTFVRFVFRQCGGREVPYAFSPQSEKDEELDVKQRLVLYLASLNELLPGDLILTRGRKQVWSTAGHIGIATGCGTMIHASYHHGEVVEEALDELFDRDPPRFACRIIR